MGQATTTQEGFDTVAQAGSGITWSNLSNMPYPTEGEAHAILTAASQKANSIRFYTPHEAVNIPVGSTFDEMALSITLKKTGIWSSGTNLLWSGGVKPSSSVTWVFTQTTDETYQTISPSGNSSYWRISSDAFSPAAIIELLKDGGMYFWVAVSTSSAFACTALIKAAKCRITYTTREGKRGAIIATLI